MGDFLLSYEDIATAGHCALPERAYVSTLLNEEVNLTSLWRSYGPEEREQQEHQRTTQELRFVPTRVRLSTAELSGEIPDPMRGMLFGGSDAEGEAEQVAGQHDEEEVGREEEARDVDESLRI